MKKTKELKLEKHKSNKAITLIALVITIIVLLIITCVALGVVDDGIIQKAGTAANNYNESAKEESNIIDEMYYYLREIKGTGKKIYNVAYEQLPEFIVGGESLQEQSVKNYGDSGYSSIEISFINYDENIQESVYVPKEYKILTSTETIKIELKDDYILYIYAFANDNSSEKGSMEVKELETQDVKCTYNLSGRKEQNVEPLKVALTEGSYEIVTNYDKTIISKIQLEPTIIEKDTNSDSDFDSEDNTESGEILSIMEWSAEENIPDWLNIITNSGLRKGDTPFTDSTITNSIKFKNGFSISLNEKTYDVIIYITGASSQRELTLQEDNSFSKTLYKRDIKEQSPIILENKTGILNFEVSGESQLYKIILTEVK